MSHNAVDLLTSINVLWKNVCSKQAMPEPTGGNLNSFAAFAEKLRALQVMRLMWGLTSSRL